MMSFSGFKLARAQSTKLSMFKKQQTTMIMIMIMMVTPCDQFACESIALYLCLCKLLMIEAPSDEAD